MSNTKKITKKLLLFLLFSFHYIYASQKFTKPEGFTLRLPSEWIEIPEQILNEHIKQSETLLQKEKSSGFDYGFQLSPKEYWLQPPYILIDVDNSLGRVSESEFKNIPKLNEIFAKGIDDFLKSSNDIINDVNFEMPAYDSENHIFWFKITSEFENAEKIKMISGFVLTQKGILKIFCYTAEEDYNQYVNLFKDIILNVQIDEQLRYKVAFLDSYPSLQKVDWAKVIAYGILGALFLLFYPYFKKKKKKL